MPACRLPKELTQSSTLMPHSAFRKYISSAPLLDNTRCVYKEDVSKLEIFSKARGRDRMTNTLKYHLKNRLRVHQSKSAVPASNKQLPLPESLNRGFVDEKFEIKREYLENEASIWTVISAKVSGAEILIIKTPTGKFTVYKENSRHQISEILPCNLWCFQWF